LAAAPHHFLLLSPHENSQRWQTALRAHLPGACVFGGEDLSLAALEEDGPSTPALKQQQLKVKTAPYALLWRPPTGFGAPITSRFPGLVAGFALGAGVDGVLEDPAWPKDLPLIRLCDAGMAVQMVEYCLAGVLALHRDFDRYHLQQQQRLWRPHTPRPAHERKVGVMGLGALGAPVAQALHGLGFTVLGWRREKTASPPGIELYYGMDMLEAFLARAEILCCLLPLTLQTRGLLTKNRLLTLPKGAALINVSRGAIIEEEALLDALNSGHLRAAYLDVFAAEPLAPQHPFWQHPHIHLTPHIAAATRFEAAAAQIAQNVLAIEASGTPIQGAVDYGRGY
jgi:glyoxylate/hydroxypyruvate reductase